MKLRRLMLALLALATLGYAAAQAATTPDFNIASWFTDQAALAAVIVAVVAFAREHVLKTLDGIAVVAFSLIVGGVFGLAGHFLGFLAGGLVPSLAFGLTAGLVASGGVDALKGILGKSRAG